MNSWTISFATLAAIFSLWFYPDESKVGAGISQANSDSHLIVGASDSIRVSNRIKPTAPKPAGLQLVSARYDSAEASRRWDSIGQTLLCARDESRCRSAETDARARHFAIRDALVEEARWFLKQTPGTKAEAAQSYRAAAQLLSFPDEAVQGAALEWILSLPPSAKTPKLMAQELDLVVDPELVRLSLLEVKRHLGREGEEPALDFAKNLLLEGGVFASREAARLIPTLLNDRNEATIRAWLAELPSDSAKARLLEEGLAQAKVAGGAL
ncbi:MAG: hypothetical protein EOP11_07975 [Proteobacteria bacterium]|nr:MAG: hypothetical protein EOP11_07975 [Pseudomonadota bacterium]